MMKINEDRNVIGVLRGCLEFSESNDNGLRGCLEFGGLVSIVSESQRMVRMELEEQ